MALVVANPHRHVSVGRSEQKNADWCRLSGPAVAPFQRRPAGPGPLFVIQRRRSPGPSRNETMLNQGSGVGVPSPPHQRGCVGRRCGDRRGRRPVIVAIGAGQTPLRDSHPADDGGAWGDSVRHLSLSRERPALSGPG